MLAVVLATLAKHKELRMINRKILENDLLECDASYKHLHTVPYFFATQIGLKPLVCTNIIWIISDSF